MLLNYNIPPHDMLLNYNRPPHYEMLLNYNRPPDMTQSLHMTSYLDVQCTLKLVIVYMFTLKGNGDILASTTICQEFKLSYLDSFNIQSCHVDPKHIHLVLFTFHIDPRSGLNIRIQ